MKRYFWIALCIGLPLTSWSMPSSITYQGTLKEQGAPVNGTRTMLFRLTDTEGLNVYWTSPAMPVTITQGLFAVVLSPTGVEWQNVSPFLEISVEGQQLLPREPITAGAYALMSSSVMDASITTPKLADGSVNSIKLASGAVTTAHLLDNTVTNAKLSAASVETAQLSEAAITTSKLANQSVTAEKLADGAVTTAKLASDTQLSLVPRGLIALFAVACPAGWVHFNALDNVFPMGGSTYGNAGGTATHQHSISNDGGHNHGGNTGSSSLFSRETDRCDIAHPNKFVDVVGDSNIGCGWDDHNHALSLDGAHNHSGSTGTVNHLPPYLTVVFCQKQ